MVLYNYISKEDSMARFILNLFGLVCSVSLLTLVIVRMSNKKKIQT